MKKLFSTLLVLVVAMTMIFAAGATEAQKVKEVPTLTWLIRQDSPAREAEVEAAANAMLDELGVGCHIDLQFINPGDYGEKLNMKLAAGEEFDLCFVANWINPNYQSLATKGALAPITQYISPEKTPAISKAISELIWKGVSINNEIYGIPNLQMMFNQPGFYVVKEIAEKAGVVDMLHNDMSEAEFEAVLAKIHAYDPELITIRDSAWFCWGQTDRYAEFGVTDFRYDRKTGKVILNAVSDASKQVYARARDWYEKGYITADAATTTMENTWRATGKLAVRYNKFSPGVDAALHNNYPPYEYLCYTTDPAVIGTNAITSTITAVNANSKHIELAVKFYEALFANPKLNNLLVFGIEGVDYKTLADGKIEKAADAYKGTGWEMGNTFNYLLTSNQKAEDIKLTQQLNETADVEVTTGFVVDDSAIKAELSAIGGIIEEYYTILKYGVVPANQIDAKVAEMVKKCENVGLAKVTAELQKQLDAFLGK